MNDGMGWETENENGAKLNFQVSAATLESQFELEDILDYIKTGVASVIEDEVTQRFVAEELKVRWNNHGGSWKISEADILVIKHLSRIFCPLQQTSTFCFSFSSRYLSTEQEEHKPDRKAVLGCCNVPKFY